ncbi:hypothetical protein HCC18_16660 [Listeria booriae]|uniref:MAE_28990/MAE_18760 family HEPN-like nuclease n=1 Tax=Listeria booriae TaxID=1552123 RepID=UPI0016243569|nr:MAE_28990/MAE_18760 family HEPN-like nuclease [Listeria booriae]MBC2318478.1 hypothetical protein [Listeria booriae]MCD2205553.1 hypothetical protein [Listeria booriae]
MKIRLNTLESLEDKITEDFFWRKWEMKNFEFQIKKFSIGVYSEPMALRSAVSLLCAHWEGFIRSASNYYVIHVISQRKKIKDLQTCFLALKILKKMKIAGQSNKINPYIDLLVEAEALKEEIFHIPYSEPNARIISTDSNLSYKKLEDIICRIGLDSSHYRKYKTQIEEQLLERRHAIVHGEKRRIDKDEFLETYHLVIELMEDFKDQIIKAAENKAYLK